ncbi:MAG: hypothetical protein KAS32_00610 [Candidatus Peribacteraceae bacterium]|nr:hypothetical protein [Candidatus Peribacteraceae bacterium]
MVFTNGFKTFLLDELLKIIFLTGKFTNSSAYFISGLKISNDTFIREVSRWHLEENGHIGNYNPGESRSLDGIIEVNLSALEHCSGFSRASFRVSNIENESELWKSKLVSTDIIGRVDDNGISDDCISYQ